MSSAEGSPSPVAPNAPKFGTLVPNRVFVGGISASTTEAELAALFSKFGNVRASKIISDRAGVSKGYGFVTFESEEEARRIQKEADKLILKDRKLNIAPAIKKQPFTRIADPPSPLKEPPPPLYYDPTSSPHLITNGTMMYSNVPSFTFPPPPNGGIAYFTAAPPDTLGPYPAPTAPQVPLYFTAPPPPFYVPAAAQYPTLGGGLVYIVGTENFPLPLAPSYCTPPGSDDSSSTSSAFSSTEQQYYDCSKPVLTDPPPPAAAPPSQETPKKGSLLGTPPHQYFQRFPPALSHQVL